jgi:hypothetical protein
MTEDAAALRALLLELYVSGVLWQDRLPDDEPQRRLDTVLAAAEGRPFDALGLPFPHAGMTQEPGGGAAPKRRRPRAISGA